MSAGVLRQPTVAITNTHLAELIANATRTGQELTLAQVAPEPETRAQKALTLHPKTAAGGIAFNLAVVAFYVLQSVWGIEPPAVVAAAVTGILTTICAWLAPLAPRP